MGRRRRPIAKIVVRMALRVKTSLVQNQGLYRASSAGAEGDKLELRLDPSHPPSRECRRTYEMDALTGAIRRITIPGIAETAFARRRPWRLSCRV